MAWLLSIPSRMRSGKSARGSMSSTSSHTSIPAASRAALAACTQDELLAVRRIGEIDGILGIHQEHVARAEVEGLAADGVGAITEQDDLQMVAVTQAGGHDTGLAAVGDAAEIHHTDL